MKSGPLFYIPVSETEHDVAGPYDLVQMAGLLRRKIITPETMIRLEGEEGWKPFGWHPQFIVAREMSPDAVSARIAEQEEKNASPIPLPSPKTLMKLGGLVVGALLAAAPAYLMARLDETTGYCLVFAGIGGVLVSACMTLVRLLDEDYWTLALVFSGLPFESVRRT